MDTATYADILSDVINEQIYSAGAKSVAKELNDLIYRPIKGHIIEKLVEMASNGRLEAVNQIGYDHIDKKRGFKVEFKFASYSMISERGKPVKTTRIRIKNSRGTNKGINIENPADFYLIGQEDAMAIISWKDLMPCLEPVGDGIDAIIPHSKLIFIFKNVDTVNVKSSSLAEVIKQSIENWLVNLKTEVEEKQEQEILDGSE